MDARLTQISDLLGDEAQHLLQHVSGTVFTTSALCRPGPNYVDEVFGTSDRSPRVLVSLQRLFSAGRLSNTGYLSILPVDQGIEHSAGASFATNPSMFDPEHLIRLAYEGGCNAVASTFGALSLLARSWAHKLPFIVKINHNELLSYPNTHDQTMFGSVRTACEMGAAGIGATIYWGSGESRRQLREVSEAFEMAHELGMFTVLWCYVRNPSFRTTKRNHETSADLTGQANHLGATLKADIIKQKLPDGNGGYTDPELAPWGKTHEKIYNALTSPHPIDLARYQVASCYMGRIGLISSGGAAGHGDVRDAVRSAVINKRAGGMGLICGRKAFQRPLKEGIALLAAIQDVYLCEDIDLA